MPADEFSSRIERRVPTWPLSLRITLGVLVVALGLAALVIRIGTGPLFADQDGRNRAVWTDDFLQDYVSARAWRDGIDPYAETAILRDRYVGRNINDGAPKGQANPHPPAAFLIVVPLSFLDYGLARALWVVFSAALIALAVGGVCRASGASWLGAVIAGIGVLALPVVQKDLSFGQNNGLILVLMVGTWLAIRRDRPGLAGALLGVAMAIKLYPAFLLIPLIRLGVRRAAAVSVVAAGMLWGLAALIVGWSATLSFVTEASPANFEYWRAGPMNLSLIGLSFRWLTENPWRASAVDLPTIAAILGAVAMLVCALATWRTEARATGDVFWASVPWMILATPLAWEHYLVLAIPVIGLALANALRGTGAPLLPVAVASALMLIGTPPGVPVSVPGITDLVQVLAYGLPLYGLAALAILGLRAAGQATSRPARPRPAVPVR